MFLNEYIWMNELSFRRLWKNVSLIALIDKYSNSIKFVKLFIENEARIPETSCLDATKYFKKVIEGYANNNGLMTEQ